MTQEVADSREGEPVFPFKFLLVIAKRGKGDRIERKKEWLDSLDDLADPRMLVELLRCFRELLDRTAKTSLHEFASKV